jgi:3-oxoacyl-[acyl-carrier protein] reductase
MFEFSGRVALITGAAGGIGRATAEYFCKCGARVVLADMNAAAVESLAQSLSASGKHALPICYDASRPEHAEAAVRLCLDQLGQLDFVIANAGIYEEQIFDEMSDEQWRRMMSINLDGLFYLCRRASPVMKDGGAIVALASVAAHQGGSFAHAHYGAAKGGVLAFSRSLARDLGPRLRVNAVSPGTIDTPMTATNIARWGDEIRERTPLRRFGAPSEVASVIAFLCSEAASFVTGETIIVAGGAYMG